VAADFTRHLPPPTFSPVNRSGSGIVYLVGAGPGDPGLITVRGAELLARADVVVYDGLVNTGLLDLVRPQAERVYAGKKHPRSGAAMTQDAINQLLVQRARLGQRVVRLKGGDPFVFGRGAEECLELATAGIPFEVVPGVTAAVAVTAYAGVPLTARHAASTVVFATGHEAAGKPESDVDWQALARAGTLVLFMALQTAEACARRLMEAGRAPTTPVMAVYWGTTAAQRTVVSTLGQLASDLARAQLKPPVLLVVGDVVTLRPQLDWFERRPLFGRRVVYTRGVVEGRAFAHALAELGAEAIPLPVVRISPPAPEALARVQAAIAQLDEYDWLVLTSASTVERFFAELHAQGRDSRALGHLRVACVGPATARALATHGVFADLVPRHGNAAAVAEAIVSAAGPAIDAARVLLPQAEHGRPEATERLTAAGARVDVFPIYVTEAVPADEPSMQYGLERLGAGGVDALACFAPSQVRALAGLLGRDPLVELGTRGVVAAIGETTARALRDLGVPVALVPSSPGAEVMAAEIADLLARRGRAGGPPTSSEE
jgi:uroporphyrinogen III methyltransferase/synthase